MLRILILCATIIKCVHGFDQIWRNESNKTFIYNNKYPYDSIINVIVNSKTTQILDFTEKSEELSVYPTRVHVSTNDTTNADFPLLITAAQQKGVLSWELPLVVPTRTTTLQFNDMARTLCPHDAGPNITSQSRPTLTLASSSPENILVKIKLRRVQNFYVELNKFEGHCTLTGKMRSKNCGPTTTLAVETINMTPSSPKYYYFSFDRDPWNVTNNKDSSTKIKRFDYKPKSVLLIIESNDDVCAFVSIQNNSCPVFDNEKDMLYQGYYFTMTYKGGITITQSMFPRGFYMVFIVKESDEDCTGIKDFEESAVKRSGSRLKTFRFRAVEAVSYEDYVEAALVVLALMFVVALLGPIGTAIYCRRRSNRADPPEPINMRNVDEVALNEESPGPSTSQSDPSTSEVVPVLNHGSRDSDLESEPDVVNPLPYPLTVDGLSRACDIVQGRRSNRYFWSALTVAVVYALPVVQLLFTYQRLIFQTGDQDVCYYNFLCAHPLGVLADFNHVYSNIGYVILGLVFMAQVRCRRKLTNVNNYNQRLGIPEHRGVLYSMGLALVMEGLLSGCYHLCPNKMNFQFDSSFMYVIAVLCMIKLYQSRHSDVNASAHTTFMLLAVVMAIGCLGMIYPNVYFWSLFTILHLTVCFFLTLKIYYVGTLTIEPALVVRAWNGLRQHGANSFRPVYPARATLLVIANLANWVLAGYGAYEHSQDVARHLLAILLGNTLLYTLGYVVLKLVHKEKIPVAAWLWLALANATWVLAASLFMDSKTKWSQTPAQSRNHNAVCSALNMLDSHDLWHLASASAIFFSFNALLILDDPLADTPRHLIPVF